MTVADMPKLIAECSNSKKLKSESELAFILFLFYYCVCSHSNQSFVKGTFEMMHGMEKSNMLLGSWNPRRNHSSIIV